MKRDLHIVNFFRINVQSGLAHDRAFTSSRQRFAFGHYDNEFFIKSTEGRSDFIGFFYDWPKASSLYTADDKEKYQTTDQTRFRALMTSRSSLTSIAYCGASSMRTPGWLRSRPNITEPVMLQLSQATRIK